ncbi:hypothetical protein RHGRI_034083 [Rhododendron griersonianum]|uniref:Uncharacterized protein n=1 Tax=Rhododendron griersonianum TaxID=479676 RepID=A0AAV6HZ81_9ERIC|nr:hypothetical protein RHGRI_034083 [Rhododendron griersonianum]
MADGTISMAEGLGCKALDSNEIRRRQKNISDPNGSLHLQQPRSVNPNSGNPLELEFPLLCTFNEHTLGSSLRQAIPTTSTSGFGVYSPKESDPQANFGVHSPKYTKSSPVRKLQQVFQNERMQLDSEARMLEIVGHLEDELNNSADPFVLDVVTAKLQSIQQSWKEAEERAASLSDTREQEQVRSPKTSPTILYNPRGTPYVEGDPNMGYSLEDTRPRYNSRGSDSSSNKPELNPSHIPHQINPNANPLIQPHQPQIIPRQHQAVVEGDPNLGYPVQDTKLRNPPSLFSQKSGTDSKHNSKPNTGQNKPIPKNWAALLHSQSPSLDMKLEYFPDLQKGKEALIEIDVELTEVGIWNRYLVYSCIWIWLATNSVRRCYSCCNSCLTNWGCRWDLPSQRGTSSA